MRFYASILLIGLCCILVSCVQTPKTDQSKLPLTLKAVHFADIENWQTDRHAQAIPAFLKSCKRILKLSADKTYKMGDQAIDLSAWQKACGYAQKNRSLIDQDARTFFEKYFTPYEVRAGQEKRGLFTGYYEPLLKGSRTKQGVYQTAIYKKPDDLIAVDLGDFKDEWKGKKLKGRVEDDQFKPYPDRKKIEDGELMGKNLELLYVDDAHQAFFLHIQGSGRVQMDDGSIVRLGYADQNGRDYYAVGRALIDRGILTKDNVSLQTISHWMKENPKDAVELMNLNPSYVFFRELTGDGPIGGEGVALTPMRSLAVDKSKWVYGLPLFLSTTLPDGKSLNQTMIAQDTGGAIKGAVRGDVFFGYGENAEYYAGDMKQKGRVWVLFPRDLAHE